MVLFTTKDEPTGSGAMGTVCGYRCKNGEKIAVKRVKTVSYANTR